MADDLKLPRLSHELIEHLNETVQAPEFPHSQIGCAGLDQAAVRERIWLSGRRYLVDELIAWAAEKEEGHEGIPDQPRPRFVRLLSEDGDVHPASISHTLDLDPGADQ